MPSSSQLSDSLFGARARLVRCAEAPLDERASFRHPEEELAVARAIDKRRREFATGRRLAHELLAELGLDRGPLLPEPSRAPAWPAGACGTITHGADRCAVAVARSSDVRALGIDIEPEGPLPRRLWRIVLRDEERARVEAAGAQAELWAKLVFSAKETTYKALAQDVGRVLGFQEVEIDLDPAEQAFRAHLLAPEAGELAPEPLIGRCIVGEGRVITALARDPR